MTVVPPVRRGASRGGFGWWRPPAETELLAIAGRLMPSLRLLATRMAADPALAGLPSLCPQAAIWPRRPHPHLRRTWAWHYQPGGPPDGPRLGPPRGVIVFCHGHGGHPLAPLWCLAPLADRLGLAMIAPCWGWGDWERADSTEALHAARGWALAAGGLPPTVPAWLVALSNGGVGALRAVVSRPADWAGLVGVCPAFEPRLTGQRVKFWAQGGGGRGTAPVVILAGGADANVPLCTLRSAAARLAGAGAKATLAVWPTADHGLLFTHTAEVLDTLSLLLAPHMPG